MHDERRRIEERVERLHNQRIKPAIYAAAVPFEVSAWQAPGEPVPFEEAAAAPYEPFAMDTPWGPPWGTTWFRMRGRVPAAFAGRRVEAVIDLGFVGDWPGNQAEALVHLADGTPLKAVNPLNQYVAIANPAAGDEVIDYLVEAASSPDILAGDFAAPTPLGDVLTAGDKPLYTFRRADIAVLDEDVWHLDLDIQVLRELMLELGEHDPRRHEIAHALDHAMDLLDLDDIAGSAAAVREALKPALSKPAHASAHRVSGVGHAHIDSAWLWPIRETKRKTSRTFSNVTSLADEYEEFVFACSQAQQYEWVRDNYPHVWARIQESVKKGQWAPVGGMWVESDGNLPGGEAIARQLVHGKRFFIEHFGIETKGVWLPDSFGYNAAYPQLAKLAGNEWFLTQKISWNQTNTFPHHTFWWEGIDGTRIFTHFPPVDTYNCEMSGREIAHAARNFKDKGGARRSLAPTGYGDGGGGTTREMIAKAARLRSLEGSATVEWERPAEFFAKAEAEYADPPVWVGELYLELHRATLTSQAWTKLGNRRSEHLLGEAELWAATAAVRAGFDYPYEQLDRVWKTVLLHQFHDILPGSSIAWVHREAESTYAAVAAELTGIINAAQRALAGTGSGSGAELYFNSAPYSRRGVPAGGAARPARAAGRARHATLPGGGVTLDNGLLRVEIDGRGLVVSMYDRAAERELVAPGQAANLLQLHPDLPVAWDAWDIDEFYRNTVTDLTEVDEIDVAEDGDAVRVRVARSFGASKVTQLLSLAGDSKRLEIATDVDWHETEKILKLAFPLDIHADRYASETQFGHVFRPTHTNTSWDAAKFEACNHRFIHLEEPGWGVALVNDATYGHDVTRTVRPADSGTTTTVRASLLRAPRFPDPDADQGRHHFRHALIPGATIGDAVREGFEINLPERYVEGGADVAPLVTVDNDGVVISAVKLADDRSGDVVLRVYESHGGRARVRVTPSFAWASAVRTDLLERPTGLAERSGDAVELPLRPATFIRTLCV